FATSGVRQAEDLSLAVDGFDQPLVLKLGQRRIHRARARAPATFGAFFQRLDHLVPVHRRLGQQTGQGRPDVAATRPAGASRTAKSSAATAAVGASAASAFGEGTVGGETERVPRAEARPQPPPAVRTPLLAAPASRICKRGLRTP